MFCYFQCAKSLHESRFKASSKNGRDGDGLGGDGGTNAHNLENNSFGLLIPCNMDKCCMFMDNCCMSV